MKKIYLYLFFHSFLSVSFAQIPLSQSRTSSYYTFIYRLNDKQTDNFHKGKTDFINKLSQPIDSFLTDSGLYKRELTFGNYLQIKAVKSDINYNLIEKHNAFLHFFNIQDNLSFSVYDINGAIIKNAKVYLNGNAISPDKTSGIYSKHHFKKESFINIEYEGIANFYAIAKQKKYKKNYYSFNNYLKSKWQYLKHRSPFRWLYNKITFPFPSAKVPNPGYITLNKPIYKPGDTVKLKAFLFGKRNHKPIGEEPLYLRLNQSSKFTDLGKVNAYRNGAYETEFVLTDSLKLKLDTYTSIELRNKKTSFNEKHISTSFKYEDYELKSIKFSLRTDKSEFDSSQKLSIYMKAVDENQLPVPDGRVILNFITSNFKNIADSSVFIPDTLFTKEIKLDAIGETKFILPTSILPKSDINFNIDAKFLNSNNEKQTASKRVSYTLKSSEIDFELRADSLFFKTRDSLNKSIKTLKVIAKNIDGDKISTESISLPGFVIISPVAEDYKLSYNGKEENVSTNNFTDEISILGYQTKDSVFVKIANPKNIIFTYSLYKGAQLVQQGNTNQLAFADKYTSNKAFTCIINYLWAGKAQKKQQYFTFEKKLLNIAVNQPTEVYPGKKSEITFKVTDYKGKPVSNTDLTAYAITSKFKAATLPSVPYFGKNRKGKKIGKNVNLQENISNGSIKIKWNKWAKDLGLDSLTYFKFTHPVDTLQFLEKTKDGSTQIAPFAIQNGSIAPIQYLYIDDIPVYGNQAETENRYSFKLDSGLHNVKIRTIKNEIEVKKIHLPLGYKLVLSINADSLNIPFIIKNEMPDTLTKYESSRLASYFFKVVDNYDNRLAYLKMSDRFYLLNKKTANYNSKLTEILVGPLNKNYAEIKLADGSFSRDFLVEGNYSFLFEKNLIKQKSLASNALATQLKYTDQSNNYKDLALDENEINQIWERYLDLKAFTQNWFTYSYPIKPNVGKLSLNFKFDKPLEKLVIRNVIISNLDNPDDIKIIPGNSKYQNNLLAGNYRILLLLSGNQYLVFDDIKIKPYGTNYYQFLIENPLPNTDTENKIWDSIKENIINNNRHSNYNNNQINQSFNQKYLKPSTFKNIINGKITDINGEGLPGVLVIIKGTKFGVTTDLNGNFTLPVSLNGKLLISNIGFESREVEIKPNKDYTVQLVESKNELNEVVVVGYGTQMRSSMTGAVTSIQGRVAGVNIVQGSGKNIMIRGTNTINKDQKPLYIVDGVPHDGSIDDINPNDILELNVLKDAEATAIYGARAAGGVVIINTKKAKTQLNSTGNDIENIASSGNLRKNFSDYAYWQPKIKTDKNGEAKFNVTFPDDITNWKTFVIGVGDKKLTGTAEGNIRSFKSLSANIAMPQFTVEGDEFNLLGKIMNYTAAEAKVQRLFKLNDVVVSKADLSLKNSLIDTFKVETNTLKDSLKAEYVFVQANGYFDGEQRSIPVYKAGSLETLGNFKSLNADTNVAFTFDPKYGEVHFNAVASLIPVLEDECLHLRNYEYLCNEQLASKLIGLLTEKKIKSLKNEPFKDDALIRKTIKKLNDNQNQSGIWGWWPKTNDEYWISNHVIIALLKAEEAGFKTDLNKQTTIDKLVFQINSSSNTDKLLLLEILKKLNGNVNYNQYLKIIQPTINSKTSVYQKLRFLKMMQACSQKINIDSLLKTKKTTMLGNIYFGEVNSNFFDNAVQNSILVYQILKIDKNHENELALIRNFLLEQRATGYWRNTYETALILETILPDILKEGKIVPSKIQLTGAVNETVSQFPYSTTITNYQSLQVKKEGDLPVYVTAFQQFWNKNPVKKSDDFDVKTYFKNSIQTVSKLKAGEEVELIVEVTPKADADYVMIEIPIPAGCSYDSKDQSWWGGTEIHREYFKNKVSIFCNTLKPKKYTFSIKLLPRYNGNYVLNPAKAEMMYFPTFYGREEMKRIEIN